MQRLTILSSQCRICLAPWKGGSSGCEDTSRPMACSASIPASCRGLNQPVAGNRAQRKATLLLQGQCMAHAAELGMHQQLQGQLQYPAVQSRRQVKPNCQRGNIKHRRGGSSSFYAIQSSTLSAVPPCWC